MGCNITTENIIKTIKSLASNSNLTTAERVNTTNKLIKVLQDSTEMSNHFESNPNSNSKLIDYIENKQHTVTADTVEGMLDSAAKKLDVKAGYDLAIAGLGGRNYQGWQSVIGYLVEDGKLNETAKQAMALVGAEWLTNDATETLASRRDDLATKGMLGLNKKDVLTDAHREAVKNIDGLMDKTANQLGAKVYKLLGIKAKKSMDDVVNNERIADTLKTELGLFILKALELHGVLHLQKVPVTFQRKGTFKPTEETWKVYNIDHGAKAVDSKTGVEYVTLDRNVDNGRVELAKQLEDAENKGTSRGVYFTAEEARPKDEEIVNEGPTGLISDVSVDHKKAIKRHSSLGAELDTGYSQVVLKLDEIGSKETSNDGEPTTSYLRELLGYKNPVKVLSKRQVSVKGKNQMIDKAVEDLAEVKNTFGFVHKMYGRWKVITNNRFMLDSNGFNWQDKKLHRNAVNFGKTEVDTDLGGNMGALFKLGLAQAFDLDIDKKTFEKGLADSDRLIKDLTEEALRPGLSEDEGTFGDVDISMPLEEFQGTDEYAVKVKAVLDTLQRFSKEKGKIGSTSEVEHAIRGAVELVNVMYLREQGETTYNTGMMIETDAITSGYGIKGLQFPVYEITDKDGTRRKMTLDEVLAELEKVGIFSPNSEYGNYGVRAEHKDTDDNAKDAYQTPAAVLSKKLSALKGVPEVVIKLLDPKAKFNEGVLEVSRAFMKDPFMVLNYGSAVKSIISKTLATAEDNFYDMVQDYVFEGKGEKDLDSALKSIFGKDIGEFGDRLNSNFILTAEERETLLEHLESVIAEPLDKTLTEEYGHFIDLSKLLNKAFTMRFELAKNMLDAKIEEEWQKMVDAVHGQKALVAPLTRKDIEGMLADLVEVLPTFNTPLDVDSKGNKAKGLIAKLERAMFEGEKNEALGGNVNTTGKVVIKDEKIKNSLDNAALEVYELVASATGGAVLPIHFFDGSVQAKVLSESDALGVHDANYGLLKDIASITEDYDKWFYELNKSYSLAKEVADGLLKSFELADETAFKDMSPGKIENMVDIITSMLEVYQNSVYMRKEIFGGDLELSIQHAYFAGPEGVVEFNSKNSKVELNDDILDLDTRYDNILIKARKELDTAKLRGEKQVAKFNVANTVDANGNSRRGPDTMFTNHTGGATGADQVWAKWLSGAALKVQSMHYRPVGESIEDAPKYVKRLLNVPNQHVVSVTSEEADAGKELNTLLGNSTHSLNNRNYVQIANSDAVYAVAPIENNRVEGGTGSATRMAEALGKPVYALNTKDVKWYKRDGTGNYVETVPADIPHNAAFIGTRDIEPRWTKKDGKFIQIPPIKNAEEVKKAMHAFVVSQADVLKGKKLTKAKQQLKQETPKQENTSAETMQENVSIPQEEFDNAVKETVKDSEQKKDEVC